MINRYILQKNHENEINFIANKLSFNATEYEDLANKIREKGTTYDIIPFRSFIVNSILDCLYHGITDSFSICLDIEDDWIRMKEAGKA